MSTPRERALEILESPGLPDTQGADLKTLEVLYDVFRVWSVALAHRVHALRLEGEGREREAFRETVADTEAMETLDQMFHI